jgi:hypothetical protein
MSTDLETDLRREFDAVRAPGSLTFSPESVVRHGRRTIRRRRIIAAGSAAMTVALVAAGATLLTRPDDRAAPLPADRTATTSIVRAEMGLQSLTAHVELNRDPGVRSNVKFFVTTDDRKGRQQVGISSTSRPGQKPDAIWKSGVVDGHPFSIGLVPGSDFEVKQVGEASYLIVSDAVKGTGYTMFAVQYQNGDDKEPARPAEIASITWAGPTGIIDGIEGSHRLGGRILNVDRAVSVKVVLRPGAGGRTTVLAQVRRISATGATATPLTDTIMDTSGVAVVAGRYPIERRITAGARQGSYIGEDGAPIATGILPSGASDIRVILKKGETTDPIAVQELLPDGRVVFAVQTEGATLDQPSESSIEAVTWTNADGSKGRKDVAQKASVRFSLTRP